MAKKISELKFDNLDEFNNFLSKTTSNQIKMEVDWDKNEWVWARTGSEITEFNILSVLSDYLKEDVEEIIVEIDGFFVLGKCKIVVVLK